MERTLQHMGHKAAAAALAALLLNGLHADHTKCAE